MKIAYIAHPVAGDIENNLEKIKTIVKRINETEPHTVPFAPYFLSVLVLDDRDPAQRARGIKNNMAILDRGVVDEIRLYGPRISFGMWQEIDRAHAKGIVVKAMNDEIKKQLQTKNPLHLKYFTP